MRYCSPVVLCIGGAALLALLGACDPASIGNGPGSTSAQQQGQTVADKIETDAALEEIDIRSIPSDPRLFGPEGALYGIVLEDSRNALYVLGTRFSDGSLRITGAVLESVADELILAEEFTEAGDVRVTIPTGDSAEYAVLEAGGLRVTLTLQGTSPASTLVYQISAEGSVSVDDAASTLHPTPNPDYNTGAITLPRAAESVAARAVSDASSTSARRAFDPAAGAAGTAADSLKSAVTMQEFNCPGIGSIVNTIDATCAVWEAVTSTAPTRTLDGACLAANGFLEGLRGSDVLPGGPPGPEFEPVVIAHLTLGVNALCALAKNGWSAGKLIKKASLPDLLCLGVTIVEEGTRIITDGRTVESAICEALGGAPVSPELDPFFDEGCDNTCEFAFDGDCDDGGPGSDFSSCELGTDCADCGARDVDEQPEPPDCSDDGICNAECPIDPADPDCGDVEFCENFDLCCDGDGVCDLARCPEQTDSDCTNLHFCDRLDVCCADDGRCDSDEFPCPETDPDCEEPPGAADVGVCPAGFIVNVSGDHVPALRQMVLDTFFQFSDYHGECRYVRADGVNPDRFLGLSIRWSPLSTGSPSGDCGSADLGDIVSADCCTRASTQRTVQASYVLSTPIVDESNEPARDAVLDELVRSAVAAGVGVACE